jgi:hypothetical protein
MQKDGSIKYKYLKNKTNLTLNNTPNISCGSLQVEYSFG